MQVRLTVDADLERLDTLPRAVKKTILRKVVRAGGAPFLKSLRQLAPRKSSGLKRSLTQVVRAYLGGGKVVSLVGQDTSKQRRTGVGADGLSGQGLTVPIHLVDRPTRPHAIRPRKAGGLLAYTQAGARRIRRHVVHPGTAGRRFIAAAAAQANAAAQAAMTEKLRVEIDAAVAKQAASETSGDA